MALTDEQLKEAIMAIDEQIADYERQLKGLRYDREGTMRQLVDRRTNISGIIIGS